MHDDEALTRSEIHLSKNNSVSFIDAIALSYMGQPAATRKKSDWLVRSKKTPIGTFV